MNVIRFILILIMLLALACGGGGGSGNSGTGVRILHGAIAIEPINLKIPNKEEFVAKIRFAEASQYFSLDEGNQTLRLFRQSNLSGASFSNALVANPDAKYSYLLYGNTDEIGLKANILEDDIPNEIPETQIALRIINTVIEIDTLEASASGKQLSTGFGNASEYSLVNINRSARVQITVQRSSDQKHLGTLNLDVIPGKAYSILATGDIDLFTTLKVISDS